MGLDAQLKRFYPLVICSMIAAAAYLQSSGITQLVGAAVGGAPAPTAGPTNAFALAKAESPSGGAILRRNAFDSVTGPLDGSPADSDEVSSGPSAIDEPRAASGNPADDPKCDGGRVMLISASDDIAWSFAAIQDKSGQSKMRRVGDEVDGRKVLFMTWDRVWLGESGDRCQLLIGDVAKAAAPAARAPSAAAAPRGGRALPPDMADKIHKVSDTEFNVERAVVDQILENQAQLMRSARIVPEKDGDKMVGIRLFGIRKGTLLETLGFQNGDRLQSINGFEISDPQKALEAYGRLRTADSLKVSVNRKGTPMDIDFNIQ